MMMQQQHLSDVRNATRAAMNWAASPVGRLVRVEVLVTLSCLLLTMLVFLGSGRRYSRSAAFRGVVWSALMLSYPAVSYTIGLMQSSAFRNDLMVVWACFLLGCADGIAACNVDDSDQQARLLFNQAAQTIYVFLLLLSYAGSLRLEIKILLFFFWVLTVVKLGLRLQRLLSVGRDRVLTVDNGLITKYMQGELDRSGCQANTSEESNFELCKYIVTGEENLQDELGEYKLVVDTERSGIVTIQDMCKDRSSICFCEFCEDLSELCISFALFKLLRRRLTGSPQYELDESVVHKVRGLFYNELVKRGKMYGIIEVELGFLFDFFYSRYPSHKQSLVPETIVFATTAALSLSSLFSSTLMHYSGGDAMSDSSSAVVIIATRFDIWLARLVIFLFLILEAFQYLSLVLSDWHGVTMGCRMGGAFDMLSSLLFWLLRSRRNKRYWSNTVGQYSLLRACIIQSETYCISRLWLPSWMRSFLVRTSITTHRHLPNSVKDAIAHELKKALPSILNQQAQTVIYYDHEHISTLEASSSGGGRVIKIPKPTIGNILILHIATTICGWKQQQANQVDEENNNRREAQETASTISAYFTYLICQAPELITDNIYETQLLLEGVQRRARQCIKDCRSEDDMYTKLLDSTSFKPPEEEDDEYKAILAQGVSTYKLFTTEFPDDAERWNLLAQLWVKFLLLNVAPSNNIAAHVKKLASGGEFITHLWTFMTQGGFVKQPWVPRGDGRMTQQDLEAQDRRIISDEINAWTQMLEKPEDKVTTTIETVWTPATHCPRCTCSGSA